MSKRVMKRYAIDKRVVGSYADHNGRQTPCEYWQEICQLEATRTSNAARVAEQKWVGWTLRVRLLGYPAAGKAVQS